MRCHNEAVLKSRLKSVNFQRRFAQRGLRAGVFLHSWHGPSPRRDGCAAADRLRSGDRMRRETVDVNARLRLLTSGACQRQVDGEFAPALLMIRYGHRAAVQLGNAPHDGQSEPDAFES